VSEIILRLNAMFTTLLGRSLYFRVKLFELMNVDGTLMNVDSSSGSTPSTNPTGVHFVIPTIA
jgi:hypothetical protein